MFVLSNLSGTPGVRASELICRLSEAWLKMAAVKLKFSPVLLPSDPSTNSVAIIGLPKNLAKISYNDIKAKFGARVSEEVDAFWGVFLALIF